MITIYTRDNCVWCEKARETLASFNIPFKVYNLGEDFSREDIKERFPFAKTYPIIFIGEKFVGGYTDLVMEIAKNENFGKEILFG